MTTLLLRPSARLLARTARLSAGSPALSSCRIARIPRAPPSLSAARLRPSSRLYSSEPPRPPQPDGDKAGDKPGEKPAESKPAAGEEGKRVAEEPSTKDEGEVKSSSSSADNTPPQPPPGFVRVSEKELEELAAKLAPILPESQREFVTTAFGVFKKTGMPQELYDVLKTMASGEMNRTDALKAIPKLMRSAYLWTKRADDLANKEGTTSDSNQAPFDHQAGNQQGRPQDGEGADGKQQSGQKPRTIFGFDLTTFVGSAIMAFIVWKWLPVSGEGREITWQEVRRNFLDKGLVEKLVVSKNRVRVELDRDATQAMYPDTVATNPTYYFTIGSVEAFENRLEEAQKELGIPPSERILVSYATEGMLTSLAVAFGPTLLLIGLLAWLSRRAGGGVGGSSGVFGFGKSRAKMFNHESAVKVKFSDVAGMDEAKVEIMEFVSFLKQPERFQRLGAKIPRGAILSGPPGTGKTLLAKATAGESQVPFFSVSGSEFVEMFVGVGASRVRDLFATARKNAPCIVFIDEIDAIGKSRSEGPRFGGNDEREATLNQILTEMDGFNTTEQVVVLAGTNRVDILDKALMRPGRFDRHINIDRPTMKGRQAIFKVHLHKIVTDEDVEYLVGRLAALTPGFSGADIANAVNEAALIAARANAQTVEMIHFEQAIERVIGGLERKSLVLDPEEKKTVAYHEAGHAICGWYFQYADPLLKVSIIPRGSGALGYAQYLPATDAYLMNVKQLMDRMAMTLGGRVSEELHFPTVTTGASDDFKKVTRMATAMVTEWGMSEKLGPLHFQEDKNQLHKPFAESTAQTIDAEVRRIVDEAYKQCRDLLAAKKTEIGLVAEELLRKEVLGRDDLVRLLGPRPFPEKGEFSKYFDAERGVAPPPPLPSDTTDMPPPTGGAQPAVFRALRR